MTPRDKTRKKYNQVADRYEEFIGPRQDAQFDLLETIIDPIALQGPVLDVGAGTGLLARHLDIDVINLDLSCGMLSHAPYPRVVADWAALPIRNETIGTFFSISALETDRDSLIFIREMWRVLKPGGWFFISVLKTQDLARLQKELRTLALEETKQFDATDAILFIGRKGSTPCQSLNKTS